MLKACVNESTRTVRHCHLRWLFTTWSGIFFINEGQQTILHCFIFKNNWTDCQINLKDIPDKFEFSAMRTQGGLNQWLSAMRTQGGLTSYCLLWGLTSDCQLWGHREDSSVIVCQEDFPSIVSFEDLPVIVSFEDLPVIVNYEDTGRTYQCLSAMRTYQCLSAMRTYQWLSAMRAPLSWISWVELGHILPTLVCPSLMTYSNISDNWGSSFRFTRLGSLLSTLKVMPAFCSTKIIPLFNVL